jgi:hypothetical protein
MKLILTPKEKKLLIIVGVGYVIFLGIMKIVIHFAPMAYPTN